MTTQYFQCPQLLPDGIELAKSGDRDAARDLLEAFCDFAKSGVAPAPVIPTALLEYLATAFGEFLDEDKSLEAALHLTKPRHREKATITWKQLRAAALYQLERRTKVGVLEARQGAAQKMHVSDDTVRRAVDSLDLSYMGDEELRALAERAEPGEGQ